jgi:protein-S-isoprenylcysteine O-methyltransferase Ste14
MKERACVLTWGECKPRRNSMASSNSENKTGLDRNGVKELVRSTIRFFIHLAVLLISAGKIWWINAWVYFGLYLFLQVVYALVMLRINPDLLNERGKGIKEGTKTFDKLFFAFWLPLIVLTLVVSGLDAARYEWSDMYLWLIISGVIISIPAGIFTIWAVAVNPYFEGTIRIQDDRDHQVCNSGPYKIVRHPGYAGLIISTLCTPLILGSWWGLVPSGIIALLVIIRTVLEDRTLQDELPGYPEYAERVRYRLVPGIW